MPKIRKLGLYDNDFKDFDSLRKYFLGNQNKFTFYFNKQKKEMPIIKKTVKFFENEDINEICGTINDVDKKLLCNSYNENNKLFKGPNAQKISKFFEKIDYDNKDENQKDKIFNNYIENYLSIIE